MGRACVRLKHGNTNCAAANASMLLQLSTCVLLSTKEAQKPIVWSTFCTIKIVDLSPACPYRGKRVVMPFLFQACFKAGEGCSGHKLAGSAGPGAQDNLMACIPWMPAA